MQNPASGGENSRLPGSSALDRLTGFVVDAFSRAGSESATSAMPVAAVKGTPKSTSIALSLLGRLLFVTVVVLVADELMPSQLGLFGTDSVRNRLGTGGGLREHRRGQQGTGHFARVRGGILAHGGHVLTADR
jgi:hypothetical protein